VYRARAACITGRAIDAQSLRQAQGQVRLRSAVGVTRGSRAERGSCGGQLSCSILTLRQAAIA